MKAFELIIGLVVAVIAFIALKLIGLVLKVAIIAAIVGFIVAFLIARALRPKNP